MSEQSPSPSRVAAARLKRIAARKLNRPVDPTIDRLADSKLTPPKQAPSRTAPVAASAGTAGPVHGFQATDESSGNIVDRRVAERRKSAVSVTAAKPPQASIRDMEGLVAQRLAALFAEARVTDVELHPFDDPTPGLWHWLITVTAMTPHLLPEQEVLNSVEDLLGDNPNNILKVHQAD
jgi:hypothetical protein